MKFNTKIVVSFLMVLGLAGATMGGCPLFGGGDDDDNGAIGEVGDAFENLGDDLFGD